MQQSLSTFSLSVISWFLLVTLVDGISCYQWKSCASSAISETSSTALACYGYQSCMNSSILVSELANARCEGSYSCAGSSIIESSRSTQCYGFHSCSNVNPLFVMSGNIYAYGASAVVNSNITVVSGGEMTCYGDSSCADSFIVSGGTHYMSAYLSGQNSIFKSYNGSISVRFYATLSGKNSTILCGNGHTCSVICWDNACTGLNLACIDGIGTCTFSTTCTGADYDDQICPNGKKLSPFMNGTYLPDLSNVSSSYNDYQTGLGDCKKPGIGQTDFCDGYQSCTGEGLKNNSVCCSALRGCANAIGIEAGAVQLNSSFVRCDGYYACNSITNGINITKASGGTVHIGGYYGVYETSVDAGGDGDIVCSGHASCWGDTLINAANLYCNGYQSCWSTTVSDITNVYAYGYSGASFMTCKNAENVYCGSGSCRQTDISNVNHDLYIYGYQSLTHGTIRSINNVFVFGYQAIVGTSITDVNQLYCDGTSACQSTIISNVSNIAANGTNVLNSATISSAADGGTMTVTLYSGVTGSVSITCETGDTCVFNCKNTDTCHTVSFLCNGICLFDTYSPTTMPSSVPTNVPTKVPTKVPTTPTYAPSDIPSSNPSQSPSTPPTVSPSSFPTTSPTTSPTGSPNSSPTAVPTTLPTSSPSTIPSTSPTKPPTSSPSSSPSISPSLDPTSIPIDAPTAFLVYSMSANKQFLVISFPHSVLFLYRNVISNTDRITTRDHRGTQKTILFEKFFTKRTRQQNKKTFKTFFTNVFVSYHFHI